MRTCVYITAFRKFVPIVLDVAHPHDMPVIFVLGSPPFPHSLLAQILRLSTRGSDYKWRGVILISEFV